MDHVLGSDADANLLEGLCELLKSIQENAGVVKVREAILAEKERAFGAESKEVGGALYDLGLAYWTLGDNAKSATTCWSARSRSSSASTVATARRWPAC